MINQELLAQAIAEAYRLAKEQSQANPSNAQENAQEGQQNPSEGEQWLKHLLRTAWQSITHFTRCDGSRGNVSKLLTIPHLNAVIACRGSLAFLQKAHAEFCTMSNFDQMAERAELVMSYALAQQGSTEHLDKYAHGAEMVLAGYSQKAGRVVIHLIRCEGIGKDTEAHLDIANAILPGNLGISLEGITASREGLTELTRRQVKAIREHAPDAAAGGNLIVAEVRPRSIAVESVGAI